MQNIRLVYFQFTFITYRITTTHYSTSCQINTNSSLLHDFDSKRQETNFEKPK